MSRIDPAAPTPWHDHIAAAIVIVLVHALVLVPALVWHAGGRPGPRAAQAGAPGGGEDDLIVTEFIAIPQNAAAKQAPATIAPPPQPARAEDPSVPEQVEESAAARSPADPASAADSATPVDPAAPGSARSGGGSDALDDDLGARYLAAVRATVLRQWQARGGGAIPAGCEVVIDQVEGGRAIRAWVMNCNVMPMADRIRLETAVMQAQALPYAGFEPVFQAHLKLAF